MKLLEAAKLFAAYAAWKAPLLDAPGRVLARGLESSDANQRLIAGMLLVRSGARAVPIIRRALEEGRGLPAVLGVAGDLGALELRPLIAKYAGDEDVAIARAAQAALRAMD